MKDPLRIRRGRTTGGPPEDESGFRLPYRLWISFSPWTSQRPWPSMSPQPCFPLAGAACPWKEPVWVTPSGTRAGRIPHPGPSASRSFLPGSRWFPPGCQRGSGSPAAARYGAPVRWFQKPAGIWTFLHQHPLPSQELDPVPGKGQAQGAVAYVHDPVFPGPFVLGPPPVLPVRPDRRRRCRISRPEHTRPWRSTNHISPLSFTKVPQRVMGNTASFRSSTITCPSGRCSPASPRPRSGSGAGPAYTHCGPRKPLPGCAGQAGPVEGTDRAPGFRQAILEGEHLVIGGGKQLPALGIDGHGFAWALTTKAIPSLKSPRTSRYTRASTVR